jgi:putative transposase
VREDGAVRSQAVLIAIGINWEGGRNILAVELASRESLSSWKELLASLRQRSLHGVEFVVSDDHAGLRRAVQEVLPEAVWQRCYVHFLRNALDYLPRKADDHCLQVVRIFPNPAACLRLVRALAVETHENWIETMQYLNMEPLSFEYLASRTK